MRIGVVGLGRMGSQIVTRLLQGGHQAVVLNRSPEPVQRAVKQGAEAAGDLADLVQKLDPVVIWFMLPADILEEWLEHLWPILPKDAIVVDGGNSYFEDTIKRAKKAEVVGAHYLDVGTSGGVLGLKNGFSMMVGGDQAAVDKIAPALDSLAAPQGWHHFGGSGAGHFVKMVHNAIEYGVMESYAEGYRMLKEGPVKGLDLAAAAEVWQHGSVIESLLNELTRQALKENPELTGIEGQVAETGEARWTLELAKKMQLDMPAIAAAFEVRLQSQKRQVNFATKLLAAIRHKFGGHPLNIDQNSK